jgi:hypothetical protein
MLAAAGALLLCGQALSQEKIRLPRKGSSPGFEMRFDGNRRVPRQGNEAGPFWQERERWVRRERPERREREERFEREERLERAARREREERRERQALLERLERRERQERQEGQERQAAECRKLARRAHQAQEEAKQKVIIGYLAGGLLGAFITSSQNDEAYKEPKIVWDETYNNCMGQGKQGQQGQSQDDDDDDDDSDNAGSDKNGANGNGNENDDD